MKIHLSPQTKALLDTFELFTLENRGDILIKVFNNLVRKNMDVNEIGRLSNFRYQHKTK